MRRHSNTGMIRTVIIDAAVQSDNDFLADDFLQEVVRRAFGSLWRGSGRLRMGVDSV